MTAFEIIDAICDSINPLLFFLALGVVITRLIQKNYQTASTVFMLLLGGLLLAYGILFIDNRADLWKSFGSDYSTHTAFAIATSIAIIAGTRWGKWLAILFSLYVIAMLYQDYHSVLDIVTTSLVVGAPLLLIRHIVVNFSLKKRQLHQGLTE